MKGQQILADLREAFDQGEFMLDCTTLFPGALFRSGKKSADTENSNLDKGRSYLSICSGEAPCFNVIWMI